jgi:hypothetical protein
MNELRDECMDRCLYGWMAILVKWLGGAAEKLGGEILKREKIGELLRNTTA